MATPLCDKRMAKERVNLEKETSEYFVHFKDDDLRSFEAYVIGPEDSLYRHKFVKLVLEIPERYPFLPPKVTFIQHTGDRIHPNLYVEGKVCLSILGTWPGEPWAYGMTCHTVLITIRSLLDNNPYRHEPGNRDSPEFNDYVQYASWRCLFLDYLRNERNEPAKAFLYHQIHINATRIMDDLMSQQEANTKVRGLTSPYNRGKGSRTNLVPNYSGLVEDVITIIQAAHTLEETNTHTKLTAGAPNAGISNSGSVETNNSKASNSKRPIDETIDLTEAPESQDQPVKKGKSLDMVRQFFNLGKKKEPSDIVDLT